MGRFLNAVPTPVLLVVPLCEHPAVEETGCNTRFLAFGEIVLVS